MNEYEIVITDKATGASITHELAAVNPVSAMQCALNNTAVMQLNGSLKDFK